MDGGHLGFDLSQSSEVKSDFPPHLKLILILTMLEVSCFFQEVHDLVVILLYYKQRIIYHRSLMHGIYFVY